MPASNLSAGTRVKALDFPRAQSVSNDEIILDITSTSYITGTPEVAVRFMAPTSGRVAISISAGTRNSGANADRVIVTHEVFTGDPDDGDVFQEDDIHRSVSNPATASEQYQYHGHLTMIDGLEPGTYYYARAKYRVTLGSGTADISNRRIIVFPVS